MPAKASERRSEQELRLQPFTLLSTIPAAIALAGGITFTCVYSDTSGELRLNSLLSAIVALPTIILFITVWRKEARRPFSLRARRIAWRLMFAGYVVATIGVILIGIIFRASGSNLSKLLLWIVIGFPMGLILYRLATNQGRG